MNVRIVFVGSAALVSIGLAIACQRVATVEPGPNLSTANSTPRSAPQPVPAPSGDVFDGVAVVRTADEWRDLLTPEQFYVMREEGTERPYTGELLKNKEAGTYHSAACRLKLFSSNTKYESNTGWPSFYQPIVAKNVTEKPEKAGDDRTEVECSRCGAHLGHVFDDGPKPTGLRYCMNSVALKFEKSQ